MIRMTPKDLTFAASLPDELTFCVHDDVMRAAPIGLVANISELWTRLGMAGFRETVFEDPLRRETVHTFRRPPRKEPCRA